MMKWVCLVVLVLDLLLMAFAGFRYITVPKKRVQAMSDKVAEIIEESSRNGFEVTPIETEEPNAPSNEDAEGSSMATDEEGEGYGSTRISEMEYVTESAPVMNTNIMGVSRQSAKLKDIEDARKDLQEAGEKALEE